VPLASSSGAPPSCAKPTVAARRAARAGYGALKGGRGDVTWWPELAPLVEADRALVRRFLADWMTWEASQPGPSRAEAKLLRIAGLYAR
jgi:hypothetical protein